MSFRVASWNIEGRLSSLAINQRGTPEHILGGIIKLGADIVFLPEAFADEQLNENVSRKLRTLGYSYVAVSYEEGEPIRQNSAVQRPSMLLLSRLPIVEHESIRLGDMRNALAAVVRDPTNDQLFRIIGVHLDDRSERLRLRQVPDVVGVVNSSPLPTIVLGDFNAMYHNSFVARLLRTHLAKGAGGVLSASLASRVADMAIGETMKRITEQTGLRDADIRRRATTTPKMRGHEWSPSIRIIQIDHILLSAGVAATGFRVARDGGSDHRAISTSVTIDKRG